MKALARSWPGAKRTVSVNRSVALSGFFCNGGFFQAMATMTKGNGTTVRRRSKSAANQAAATVQESNGMPAHNSAPAARLDSEMNIETIRVRAYQLFIARGATHGNDLADWLNAERELVGAPRT
jgi:Protein of unknown function (DUF2934)